MLFRSHQISIYQEIIGPNLKLEEKELNIRVYQNPENKFYCTGLVSSIGRTPILHGFSSWGSPYSELKITIACTNCKIELNGGSLRVYTPRDSFSNDGNFIDPPCTTQIDDLTEGIEGCSDFFIEALMRQEIFSKKSLLRSLWIGEQCLNAVVIHNSNSKGQSMSDR